ncbi:CHC2 zinc finger [Zunongwangia mangrovi]|uniref:CHC2 zinc finger n=1 Tax=Zunongwangia mangrovi TaxID=1334022 RepID=A0A1I1IS10_9FLAO|nr:toprim domain-containing protein [Zunongwangia mangrovi]SFC38731.1 CHC2 zinc finger [Zunongwangia mangrovi]
MKKNNELWSSARNTDIIQLLKSLGHYPTKTKEKEAWFLSPLRSETQASFIVSKTKNLWYDFGLSKGGNSIDLIMNLKSCNFQEALNFLKNPQFSFSFNPPAQISHEPKIKLLKTSHFISNALQDYIMQRGIPIRLASRFLEEVTYKVRSGIYFSLGLKNHKNGWELRNAYFKTVIPPKSYTHICWNHTSLCITEGMFDFLSLGVLEKESFEKMDHVILNSLACVPQLMGLLPSYSKIYLYLDNDPAGDRMTSYLLEHFAQAIDLRYRFYPHKDLNEKLCHVRRENTL